MNSQDQLPVQDPCKKARRLTVGYSSGDSPIRRALPAPMRALDERSRFSDRQERESRSQ
jgi:hypothetical protein